MVGVLVIGWKGVKEVVGVRVKVWVRVGVKVSVQTGELVPMVGVRVGVKVTVEVKIGDGVYVAMPALSGAKDMKIKPTQ